MRVYDKFKDCDKERGTSLDTIIYVFSEYEDRDENLGQV